jgi:hypothetical protein
MPLENKHKSFFLSFFLFFFFFGWGGNTLKSEPHGKKPPPRLDWSFHENGLPYQAQHLGPCLDHVIKPAIWACKGHDCQQIKARLMTFDLKVVISALLNQDISVHLRSSPSPQLHLRLVLPDRFFFFFFFFWGFGL